MTPDEKRENIKAVYGMVIDDLVDIVNELKRWDEEARNHPVNKHTMTTLDELIGHLQQRREKMVGKVK